MTSTKRLALFYLIIGTVLATGLRAQGTYTAASCNESDVSAAIAAEQAKAADGDIISIPAGTCTWSGGSGIAVNFHNSVTIQGAGAQYATAGGAGTAGSDSTVIIDNLTYNGNPSAGFLITTVSGKSFRLTGIYIEENSSSTVSPNGFLSMQGNSTAVRIDHCHFYQYVGSTVVYIGGSIQGVADHDLWSSLSGVLNFDYAFHNGQNWQGDTAGNGDQSWVDGDHWGSSEFFYVEDNQFNNGDVGDAHDGARYVIRYSTMKSSGNNGQMFNHGIDNGRARSVRASEFYMNTFTAPGPPGAGNDVLSLNGGTLLFWGNTITNYRWAVGMDYTRKSNGTYTYTATPGGWGYCGTTDGPSNWDQNSTSAGYACLDSSARGAGQLITGSFPNVVNTSTGSIAWPNQVLDPAYVWDNAVTPSSGYSPSGLVSVASAMFNDNIDFYQQFGTYGESGSFSGAKGVGQGTYSQITSSCAAGPGGNTPGVGYWATDQSTLYVCNPTNTWKAYYTPYTYPHPLTGTTAPLAPPTNVTAVGH